MLRRIINTNTVLSVRKKKDICMQCRILSSQLYGMYSRSTYGQVSCSVL